MKDERDGVIVPQPLGSSLIAYLCLFCIPPLLEPCKTVPYLDLRESQKNLLISLEIMGFHANYVKCYSILQL